MKTVYAPVEIAREYWDFIQTVLSTMPFDESGVFVYGLNEQRTKLHDALCEIWKLDKMKTKEITDHLDRYEDFESFLAALSELQKDSESRADE